MDQTKVTCTTTDVDAIADILEKSSMKMRVVMVGSTMPFSMHKKTPHDTYYIGSIPGMEVISTGEKT